jgi:tetratricopeptide (TPR) repeat protein
MPIPRLFRRQFLALALLGLVAQPLASQAPDPVERGIRLVEQRRFAEARQVLEPHARANPQDARAAFHLGRALLAESQADPAIEWLERAVRLDARQAAYHAALGNAYGLKAGSANVIQQARLAGRARGAFERAVALDPDDLDGRWGLFQFHMIAPGVMGGDRQKAREQATEIRKRNPYRGAQAWATLHNADRNYAGVATELEAAVRQYPDSAAAHVSLALAYDQLQRHDAALELLEGFLRRRPDEMSVLYQVGRLGAVSGQRLDRAEQALKRYLQHAPQPGQPPLAAAHWRLGMVHEKQGRPDQARAEYRAALVRDPNHRESRQALRRLGG